MWSGGAPSKVFNYIIYSPMKASCGCEDRSGCACHAPVVPTAARQADHHRPTHSSHNEASQNSTLASH